MIAVPRDAALVVRPNRDSPENGAAAGPMAYGQLWMGYVLSSLRWTGAPRKELRGNDAVGDKFDGAVRTENPSLVAGAGHGSADTWVGQYVPEEYGYSTLLTTYNADLMKDRVVYLLSCLTAKELGPEIVRRGARAYAGYREEFVWTVESPESPATDRLAAPFGAASTAFPKVLIGGRTVREARERTLEAYEAEMEEWERSEDPYAREVVKWLNWDMQALAVEGDEEARGLKPRLALGLVLSAAAVGVGALVLLRKKGKI